MKILLIGGTQFIGQHLVRQLMNDGHDVTLLNRGKTGPNLFPELKLVRADREQEGFESLSDLRQNWDAVVDLCAYFPKPLRRFLHAVNGFAGMYVQCSTISVYKASINIDPSQPVTETSEIFACSESEAIDTTMMTYGPRKAECERIAMDQQCGGVPVVIIRPSVVYGEHDHTDRFAYWIWRATRNKKFILPEDGLTTTQKTYAPDLASAFAAVLKRPSATGRAYNIADTFPLNLRSTIQLIGKQKGIESLDYAVSIDADTLQNLKVSPWSDIPLWIPRTNFVVDTFRARSELDFTSTSADAALKASTEAFLKLQRTPKAGLSDEAEANILSLLNRG